MSKKIIALLLAVLMMFVLAACQSEEKSDKDKGKKQPSFSGDEVTEEPTLSEEENTVSYLMLNYSPSQNEDYFIIVTNLRGETKAEMNADTHKVAQIDPELLFEIEEEMIKSGIMDMVGMDVFEDGDAIASVYMEYTDGTPMMVNFSGVIPDTFISAYKHMEEYFAKLLKNAPEYIPEPKVTGEVDAAQLQLLLDILNKSGMEKLDGFRISTVEKNAHTAENLGLDSDEFVVSASVCESTMMEVPYNLVVLQVNSQENIEALRSDMADGLRFDKWVVATADKALIAQKDDLVLCLIADGDNYAKSAKAIADCGWETVTEYTN